MRRLVGAGIALAASACIAPPALLEVDCLPTAEAFAEYPHAESVEIRVDDDVLRGFFVPSTEGAPIVVQLLGSGSSAAGVFSTPAGATFQLAGLGFASLVIDYAGVSLSSGSRHVDHLVRDATAIWEHAVARAGGDRSRVHVRATSIGTIATAGLLDSGARPASVVLVAPVTPESVVARGAASIYGDPLGLVAEWIFRPVANVGLADVLPLGLAPTLVIAPTDDQFLWDRERAALRIATDSGGGRWSEISGEHIGIAALANGILLGEETWWIDRADEALRERELALVLDPLDDATRARFASGTGARARLASLAPFHRLRGAKDVAAAAFACEDVALAVLTLRCIGDTHRDLAFDTTVECFSPRSFCEPLTVRQLLGLAAVTSGFARHGVDFDLEPAMWWRAGAACANGEPIRFETSIRGPRGGRATASIQSDSSARRSALCDEREATLRCAHLLLRAAGRPCRIVEVDGRPAQILVHRGGVWHDVVDSDATTSAPGSS